MPVHYIHFYSFLRIFKILCVSTPLHLCMCTTCVPSTYGGHQGDRKVLPMMTGVKGEGEHGPQKKNYKKTIIIQSDYISLLVVFKA